MSIKTRLIGGASALVLTGSMLAFVAPAAYAAPVTIGTCTNLLALGSAKSATINPSTGKNYGITDLDNLDGALSGKGTGTPSKTDPLGTCNLVAGQGAPDGGKPPALIAGGTHTVTKWSTKLFSREFDCNTNDTGDTTEWAPSGALSIAFADTNNTGKANAITAQVTVDGFAPGANPGDPSDVVNFHGIVSKGALLGADVAGQTEFDPTVKDKTQTTNTPYAGYQFDVAGALGCTTATVGDANILLFNNGSVAGKSQLLGLNVAGITFTKGTP